MPEPNVFVSFSGDDRPLVRQFIARLQAQPIQVWNYADEAQEIRGGETLDEYLKAKIDRSEYFFPLITPNFFAAEYTRAEVIHVLDRARMAIPRIIPLALKTQSKDIARHTWPELPGIESDQNLWDIARHTWPRPFKALKTLRFRSISFDTRIELEKTIIALCRDMNVRYLPLPTTDVRLPFLDRFHAEIRDCCSRHPEKENALYPRLMSISNEFQEAYGAGDFPRALARIQYFTLICEYEFPAVKLYYPYVVKAVCEISCGSKFLIKAKETLESLLSHPSLDVNVFGALGYIAHNEGIFPEALKRYREALARAPSDPAAKAGVVHNAIMCGEPIDVDLEFAEIDRGNIAMPEDRLKVAALKAYALWHTGRLAQAQECYEALLRDDPANAAIVVNFAHVLVAVNAPWRARALLEHYYLTFPENDTLLHFLASLTFQLGDRGAAVDYFSELIERFPRVRQYWIDAAQVFLSAGLDGRVEEAALAVLDRARFPLPETPDDFYYDGFANWFLNRPERARYDFERSGEPGDRYYDTIISKIT